MRPGLLCALLCLSLMLLAGCAALGPREERVLIRGRDFSGAPVMLWCDVAGSRESLSEPEQARAFARQAASAGVTHLALEMPDDWTELRLAAAESRLRLAAVLPLFRADDGAAGEPVVQKAFWTGEAFEIRPLSSAGLPDFLSPASASARDANAEAVRAIAADPLIETIILSGLGFQDTLADLGPRGRVAFESWTGITMRRWPEDVIGEKPTPLPIGPWTRGQYWDAWMLWRASVLKEHLIELYAAATLPGALERPRLAVLVDAPYPAHQRMGLNWAAARSNATTDYRWLPEGYDAMAAGHLMDALVLGFWEPGLLTASDAEREGFAWWASVEGATAAALRYRGEGTTLLGAISADDGGTLWPSAARVSLQRTGGVVLLPASHFLANPEEWEMLRLAVVEGAP